MEKPYAVCQLAVDGTTAPICWWTTEAQAAEWLLSFFTHDDGRLSIKYDPTLYCIEEYADGMAVSGTRERVEIDGFLVPV